MNLTTYLYCCLYYLSTMQLYWQNKIYLLTVIQFVNQNLQHCRSFKYSHKANFITYIREVLSTPYSAQFQVRDKTTNSFLKHKNVLSTQIILESFKKVCIFYQQICDERERCGKKDLTHRYQNLDGFHYYD